ncbi:MAG: prepilin-type N-terminal cleavage/methylation domain-containing protein [Candidatus Omnitrophota bacterium]
MLRSSATCKRRGGFLLLEVLVSITVISVGLVYIIRSFSNSSRAIETAAYYLKAISLIEERLWDLEAQKGVERGRDSGRFESDARYSWKTKIEEAEDLPVNSVGIEVEWDGLTRKQRVSLKTCMWNYEEE